MVGFLTPDTRKKKHCATLHAVAQCAVFLRLFIGIQAPPFSLVSIWVAFSCPTNLKLCCNLFILIVILEGFRYKKSLCIKSFKHSMTCHLHFIQCALCSVYYNPAFFEFFLENHLQTFIIFKFIFSKKFSAFFKKFKNVTFIIGYSNQVELPAFFGTLCYSE